MDARDWTDRDQTERCPALNLPFGGDSVLWCHKERGHGDKHEARFGIFGDGVTKSRAWADESPNHYTATDTTRLAALFDRHDT